SALGWDHHEKPEYHPSQVDYAKGFVAISKPDGNSLSSIRQRFEQKTTSSTNSSAPSAAQQRVLEERARWEAERKKKEKEQLEEISSTKGATVSLDSNKAVSINKNHIISINFHMCWSYRDSIDFSLAG
ncbi:unnamed protein product, partial [Trichobilharzia regenti]